jgi:hypothetical protein
MYKIVAAVLINVLLLPAIKAQDYHLLINNITKSKKDTVLPEKIMYHNVRVDERGNILPWYSANLGESYDFVLNRVWEFWKNMDTCENGLKYYINHMIWQPGRHHKDGIGGDQFMMALSSWDLYYNYTGNEEVIKDMKYIADYYLAHSLSLADCEYPYLPYPNNLKSHSGEYDGDMMLGKGFLQLDKAGSFGFELLKLYKKTGDKKYLLAAVKIANTLASKVKPGDNDNSPLPFKVNAKTGETGGIVDPNIKKSTYTTFLTSTLNLFSGLIELKEGNSGDYKKAFDITIDWLRNYPAKTNKWGPFFEDIKGWSDTQINGITYAMYIMEHPDLDPNWQETVNNIFKWVHIELGNKKYINYGVMPTNEQTAYRVPGNSHSSRQASVELMYWEKTGDTTYVRNAIRQLNWATYMVNTDGKNCYPIPDNRIWLTDGYGDYVRHYLRAMAAAPQLAPDNADHLLRTSSIICNISYQPSGIQYNTFDKKSEEIFRLTSKPKLVKVNGKVIKEFKEIKTDGWIWQSFEQGGILRLKQSKGNRIEIIK